MKATVTPRRKRMTEKIKAAATKDDSGIHLGPDHATIGVQGERGFMTTLGRFVDRKEGMEISKAAGQLLPGYDAEELHAHMTRMEDYPEKEEADDLSTKTVLISTNALFVSLAERLGRDFKKVYLYVPKSGSFPQMSSGMLGYGLKNVELVEGIFGPHFASVDLFVFPDLGTGAIQIQLEKMGKRVWGPRNAEELEIYREVCKERMETLGLPVQPWTIVKGVTALEAHLRTHKDQHVKIDKWRGVTETFFSPTFEIVEPKVHAIAETLGPFREELKFICEDDLPDREEVGVDTYCIDGQYPENTLFGIEAKDCGYVGQMVKWDEIPEPLRRWNEALAPDFARYGCRASVSNEIRIGPDKEPFMVDATIRAPSPPSELWQELFTNLSEIIWHGANGVLIEPIPAGKWGVQVIFKSQWAENNLQLVDYPEKYANQIKLYNCVVVDGKRYVVPQHEDMMECGAVVGWGETLEEAIEHVTEAGEAIQGYGIKFSMGPIDSIKESIEKLEKIGVSPFKLDKP